jgi:hypothetical protein
MGAPAELFAPAIPSALEYGCHLTRRWRVFASTRHWHNQKHQRCSKYSASKAKEDPVVVTESVFANAKQEWPHARGSSAKT